MEEKICPYPGLRPFNDDESIFFKGRERNIDTIIELFEQKKFMMLTGASGDGKSSLVYAGIVPHARAGLFKAKYNNWIVADFKPERTPLDNLTSALNIHFKYDDQNQLKEELSLGFSSLTKIYKNSPFFITEENNEWAAADDLKKKQLKRKASNLLIIADQFEEFFTNSENFNDGSASIESQTVINLLLETAKIALAEDLPIYVVCTMRSDYIGQCAAFRGLPEYIGFSQFFVPRLKRKEIQQVIEEPAQLNGDKISDRLIQRLLYDISDGLDQLPILQHALNQIWKMADNGKYEMDLIHYAKVGGLPADELPPEDRDNFAIWFAALPDFKKQLFANPSLENILNAHANELLEFSYQNFIERNPSLSDKITQEQAKTIIKTTFQCLTKIDAARAVRNRMTLQEITDIINDPSIDVKMVGKVLDIFREQGNTFIKPFITSDIHTLKTHKHTVLDITHESLIRNWDILKTWAYEEFDNWSNFQDFNKQLQRWIKSGKTSGYLLPIGPLTFFENWYDTCKPNKYWLARYSESEHSFDEKLKHTEENLNEADSFIKNSAKKLFITRTVMKYGANKILAIFGLIVLFGACAFYYNDYREKQNDYIISEISVNGLKLLNSNQVNENIKAKFLVNYERLNPNSIEKLLNSLKVDTLAYDLALATFASTQSFYNKVDEIGPFENRLLIYLDSLTTSLETKQTFINISRVNKFLRLCAYTKKHHPSSMIDELISKHLRFIELSVLSNLDNNPKIKTEEFSTSIELLLTLSVFKPEKAAQILTKLSPFSELNESKFAIIYPKKEKLITGRNTYLSYKGGYQILSYLYCVTGDYINLNRCLDSLIISNPEYKNSYRYNIVDILCYVVKYQNLHSSETSKLISKYLNYSSSTKEKLFEYVINFILEEEFNIFYIIGGYNVNVGLIKFCISMGEMNAFWDCYLTAVSEKNNSNSDEVNFNLAIFYKKKGVMYSQKYKCDNDAKSCFKRAFDCYTKVSEKYLNTEYVFYAQDGMRNSSAEKIKNSTAFLYPNVINNYGWQLFEFYTNDFSDTLKFPFFDFIINNKFENYYKSEEDLKSLEKFIYQYYYVVSSIDFRRDKFDVNDKYLNIILKDIFGKSSFKNLINENVVKLLLIDRYFELNETSQAFKMFKTLNLKEVLNENFQKQEEIKKQVHINLLKNLALNLAVNDSLKASFKILGVLINPWDRRNSLIDICYAIQNSPAIGNTFLYIDSLYKEIDKKPKVGMKIFMVNGLIGSNPLYNISMNLYKDIDDKLKPRALSNFLRGIANTSLYYKARTYIPKYVSRTNELDLYNEILHAEIIANTKKNHPNFVNKKYWFHFDEKFYGLKIPENYEYEFEHFQRFSE